VKVKFVLLLISLIWSNLATVCLDFLKVKVVGNVSVVYHLGIDLIEFKVNLLFLASWSAWRLGHLLGQLPKIHDI